jgi:hypothetical protein
MRRQKRSVHPSGERTPRGCLQEASGDAVDEVACGGGRAPAFVAFAQTIFFHCSVLESQLSQKIVYLIS